MKFFRSKWNTRSATSRFKGKNMIAYCLIWMTHYIPLVLVWQYRAARILKVYNERAHQEVTLRTFA
ncbi:hypothetical protein L1049_009996 [Liquidambar formosana]|uniref:Uncharacterized protein n=1 Tax=Liquidambar formosana TaxID=63359 RepID=A0AAP0R4H7_LIQFO